MHGARGKYGVCRAVREHSEEVTEEQEAPEANADKLLDLMYASRSVCTSLMRQGLDLDVYGGCGGGATAASCGVAAGGAAWTIVVVSKLHRRTLDGEV